MDIAGPTSEPQARIPAHSRRQAMDWSLALASQEIHPVIAPPGDGVGWGLLVEPDEFDRAMEVIRLYRLENKGWNWKKELPGAELEVHSGSLFFCLALAMWYWVTSEVSPRLSNVGRMDSAAVLQGSWWRLFTPVTLHADLAHLMGNITFGVIILGFSMARYGAGITLLATYLCGALGNLLGTFAYARPYTGVGASGMMMGALGLLCIHSFGLWRHSLKAARYILSGVIAGFLLFVLFGLDLKSDILAHFGGFIGGLLFGAILSFFPERKLQNRGVNVIALGLFAAMLILTWIRAVR